MGVSVRFKDDTKLYENNITTGVENAFRSVVLDVKRVSSQSAPHKTGFLENNRHVFANRGGSLEAYVGFSARSKQGFDYATWTHEKKYNLGAGSKAKLGGKSKYGGGVVPVGTGYLRKTIEQNSAGYLEHIEKQLKKAMQ